MEWRDDVGPARAGNTAARERLREYLTPFAHGVALAQCPHHLTERLVPQILDESFQSLGGVEDDAVGTHVMNVARRLAKETTPGPAEEQHSSNTALLEARQILSRLRALPERLREHLVLRLVEGIPGPELAAVAQVPQGELRAELERAAAEAARVFGQGVSFAGDAYLWELSGAPPPLLARLEVQLPVLRFDPTLAPMQEVATAGTFLELTPVGAPALRKPLFQEPEGTETGVVTVDGPSPHPALAAPNPFERAVRTIAAADLPAEAQGQVPLVPWVDPSRSQKVAALPQRPVPAPGDGERSAKSGSGKRVAETSRSGRQNQLPAPLEVTKDGPRLEDEVPLTEARVPALVRTAQAELSSSPHNDMLGRPTMQMPLSAAVGPARVAPAVTNAETRIAAATAPAPVPRLAAATLLQGTQPLFLAAALAVVGVLVYFVSMFADERQTRASWQLTRVVVAAEDLPVGSELTLENLALRAVPVKAQSSGAVKAEAMDFVLGQRLAVDVQMGDPLFYVQFVSVREKDMRLSRRVPKRTRGFTIATNVVAAVGRALRPSDLVDVVVTFPLKARGDRPVERRAVTLLQKVPVLATGKVADELGLAVADDRARAYADVTLLLSPEEAEALTLAAELGRVKLTLRNQDDLEEDRNLAGAWTDSDTLSDHTRRGVVRQKRQAIIQILRGASPSPSR